MKKRCENQTNSSFHNYGGRGIYVCERWQEFTAFLSDMGPHPGTGWTIERLDNNDPYAPENCVWIKRVEQAKNTRRNHWLEHKGERMVLSDWARRLNIKPSTISKRLRRGWPISQAVTTP